MQRFIKRRLHSLRSALTTMPDRQTWYHCGVLFGVASTAALALGWQSKLLRFDPLAADWATRLTIPFTLFVFPGVRHTAMRNLAPTYQPTGCGQQLLDRSQQCRCLLHANRVARRHRFLSPRQCLFELCKRIEVGLMRARQRLGRRECSPTALATRISAVYA